MIILDQCYAFPGALKYESDGYVPTTENENRGIGVGFLRKKRGVLGVGLKKNNLFCCKLPK